MKSALKCLKKCMLFPAALLVALGRTISRKTKRIVMANFIVVMFVFSLVFGGISIKVFSENDADDESKVSVIDEAAIDSAREPDADDLQTTNVSSEQEDFDGVDNEELTSEESSSVENGENISDEEASANEDKVNTVSEESSRDEEASSNRNEDNITGKEASSNENEGNVTGDPDQEITEEVLTKVTGGVETGDKSVSKEASGTLYNDIEIQEEELNGFDAPDIDMVVEADGYTSTYDGGEHSIALIVTDPASGAEISYATSDGGTYDEQLPMFSAAGEYTVYYKITADGYNTCTGSASVNISKRNLVITPDDDQKKEYGDEDVYPFTYEADGLLTGDSLDGELGREEGEAVGSYDYTLGTLSNDNYNISLADDSPTYDIVQKPLAGLTIIQDERTYTYDGANHSPIIEVTNGDKPLVEGVDYNISGSVSESEAGDYVIFIEGCGNYMGFYAVEYKIEGAAEEEKIDNSGLEPKAADAATTEAATAATTAEPVSTTTEQKSTVKEIVVENLITTQKTEKTTEEASEKKTTKKKNNSTKDLAKADQSNNKTGEKDNSGVKSVSKTDVQTGDKAPIEFLWLLVILSGVMLMILNIMERKITYETK